MPINWRGIFNFLGQTKHGSSGSYTQFANDGRQTMVGAAKNYKELWLPAGVFDVNASGSVSASNLGTSGCYPILRFGGCGLLPVYATFLAPLDASTTGSVLASVCWSASTDADAAVFRIGYDYMSTAEGPGTTSGSIIAAASCVGASQMTSSSIGNLASFTAGEVVALRLEHDGTSGSDDSGSTVDVWGVKLKYVADKLGSQAS